MKVEKFETSFIKRISKIHNVKMLRTIPLPLETLG